MKIFSVDQVWVVRRNQDPPDIVIHAVGRTATTGWKNPFLDNSADPNPDDAVIELSFEAERPDGVSLPVLTPISATLAIAGSASAVIVRARTNSISVHASQFQPEVGATPTTTFVTGEAQVPTTTIALEELLPPTTFLGFEQLFPTTHRLGEEGLSTDPRLDDPAGPPFTNNLVRLGGPFGVY